MVTPKKYYVPIDLNGNEVMNFSAERLATAPVTTFPGRTYFDTTLDTLRIRNAADTSWIDIGSLPPGLFKLTGTIADANTNPAFPASPAEGDVHLIITTAGTVGGLTVEPGDMLVYVAAQWTVIEKNQIRATELVEGYTRLATQAETDAGTDDTTAITPLKLKTYLANLKFVKQYEAVITGDGVLTEFPVVHALGTTSVQVEVSDATGKTVVTDVTRTDGTTVTIGLLPAPANGDTFEVVVQAKAA